MDRLSKDEYGCLLALMAKSRSEDPCRHIGGVAINHEGRVIATGYNGLKAGMEVPKWMYLEKYKDKKGDFFIHAESNVCSLIKKGDCHTLYLNQSPCFRCCQNIAAKDIKRVVYLTEYRCQKYKEILSFYNIDWMELKEDGKKKILDFIKDLSNFKELYEKSKL